MGLTRVVRSAGIQVLPQLAEELDSAFAGTCGLVLALGGVGNLADIAESAPCLRTRRSRVQALLDEFLGAYEYKGCKAPPRRVRVIECTGVMVPRVEYQTAEAANVSDELPATLDDGSAPATPEALLGHLADLGIEVETVTHAPVFTVDEAKAVRGELSGGHTKNLFLRNKKGRMWLIVCPEDRQIDLKSLAQRLDAGRFSFGSADRLIRYLGVIPGAVTPFAVINDHGGAVKLVIDSSLLESATLNVHPLDNAMTTAITPADLVRFLESVDHAPDVIALA